MFADRVCGVVDCVLAGKTWEIHTEMSLPLTCSLDIQVFQRVEDMLTALFDDLLSGRAVRPLSTA